MPSTDTSALYSTVRELGSLHPGSQESPRQRIFMDTYPVPAGDSAEGKAASTLTSLVGCSHLKRLLLST